MSHLAQLFSDYSQNTPSFLIFCIAFVIAAILVVTIALSTIAFTFGQFANLFALYTRPATEDLSKFHPYTRSILQNTCPEFRRIQELKAMPRTGYTRSELKKVVQSVIDTLEENEEEPVKHTIIRQLKSI